ncbi:MAG TPA: hypothetical protein VKQ52_06415, partial [Puia sp.]|nr:hypothetical protein [Puia sp.]
NAAAQITAGDIGASQQGNVVTEDNVQPGTLNVGQLSACGVTINQYVTVTFNNSTYSQTSGSYLYYGSGNFESFSNPYMTFSVPGLSGTGTFSPSNFMLYTGNYRIAAATDNTLRVNVTTFGAVNQYVIGTLGGNVYDSTSKTVYPLTGNFKLLRTN